MPPANSTSGGAQGVLSHAMSPVCETKFDIYIYTPNWQLALSFSLRHAAVTACLQSTHTLTGTVPDVDSCALCVRL